MRFTIKVTGAAGLWMNSTADIIADVFAELGYHVNTDIQYQSIIKGWVNYFDIFISDKSKYISKYSDIIIALDAKNLKAFLPFLKKWGIIIVNQKHIKKLETQEVSFSNYKILGLEIDDKYDNTYLISALVKLLNIDIEIIERKIKKTFERKWPEMVEKNLKIFRDIYENYILEIESPVWKIGSVDAPKGISYWNKALAYGAIDNELEYFSAYPMTPASTVLTEIIKSGKVTFLQAEDEISVIMGALGASFTGARSMVATSGWVFALMVEAICFSQQAELWIVMILAQRAGPSTGTPTFHEQWDITLALHPSFWDFDHIVIVPSTLEDGYYLSGYALNLAQKYQTVVIVLTDKQYAEGKATIDWEFKTPWVERGKLVENPTEDFKRYELTDDGVSPYTKPGTKNGDFIATSYEHDEYGATTEDTKMKMAMTEKRWKKLKNFYEKEGITGYDIINPTAKKMIITMSYISYTAKEFVKNNPDFGLIIVKILKPLDERIKKELEWKDEVIFVESNYSWQLENYIVKEFWLKYMEGLTIKNMRKYDLYPFYYEDFETLLHK